MSSVVAFFSLCKIYAKRIHRFVHIHSRKIQIINIYTRNGTVIAMHSDRRYTSLYKPLLPQVGAVHSSSSTILHTCTQTHTHHIIFSFPFSNTILHICDVNKKLNNICVSAMDITVPDNVHREFTFISQEEIYIKHLEVWGGPKLLGA